MRLPTSVMRVCLRLLLMLLCTTVALAGCGLRGAASLEDAIPENHVVMTEEEHDQAMEEVASTAARIERLIRSSAGFILAQRTSRETRQAVLLWQAGMTERLRGPTEASDPRVAALQLHNLTLLMRERLLHADTQAALGPHAAEVMVVADESAALSRATMASLLDSATLAQIEEELPAAMRAAPLGPDYQDTRPEAANGGGIKDVGLQAATALLSIPLAPLTVVRNMDQGAGTLSGFLKTAHRFVDALEDLPQETRWQLELLTLYLEGSDVVTSATLALGGLSESSGRLAGVAESLPEETRATVSAAVDEIIRAQPQLERLASDAVSVVEGSRALSLDVRATLAEATVTAAALEALGRELQAVKEAFSPRDRPIRPDRKRSDLAEFGDGVAELGRTTVQLRALLAEIHLAGTSPEFGRELATRQEEVLSHLGSESQALADMVFWRVLAALLVATVLGAALLVLHHVLAARRVRDQANENYKSQSTG